MLSEFETTHAHRYDSVNLIMFQRGGRTNVTTDCKLEFDNHCKWMKLVSLHILSEHAYFVNGSLIKTYQF